MNRQNKTEHKPHSKLVVVVESISVCSLTPTSLSYLPSSTTAEHQATLKQLQQAQETYIKHHAIIAEERNTR
jgi:hypothetical protein